MPPGDAVEVTLLVTHPHYIKDESIQRQNGVTMKQLREVELAGGVPSVNFTLEPGNSIRLRVVGVDGLPIENVEVEIEQWRGVYGVLGRETLEQQESLTPPQTDRDGVYHWRSAPDEAVKFQIFKPLWSRVETELIADGTVQTITLYRTAVISGKVIDDATGDRISPVELVPSGQTGRGV